MPLIECRLSLPIEKREWSASSSKRKRRNNRVIMTSCVATSIGQKRAISASITLVLPSSSNRPGRFTSNSLEQAQTNRCWLHCIEVGTHRNIWIARKITTAVWLNRQIPLFTDIHITITLILMNPNKKPETEEEKAAMKLPYPAKKCPKKYNHLLI